MSMWLLLNVIAAAGVGITVYAFAAAVVGPWEGPPTSRPEGLTPAPPTPAPCESFRFRELPLWVLITVRVLVILFFCAVLGTLEGLLGP